MMPPRSTRLRVQNGYDVRDYCSLRESYCLLTVVRAMDTAGPVSTLMPVRMVAICLDLSSVGGAPMPRRTDRRVRTTRAPIPTKGCTSNAVRLEYYKKDD